MTVQEFLDLEKIDDDLIDDWSFCDSYKTIAVGFLRQDLNREIDTLSPKHGAWLTKIVGDLVEYRTGRK